MFQRLRNRTPATCSEYTTALDYLQSGNFVKMTAAIVFISRQMVLLTSSGSALASSIPPAHILLAVVEHGLNAESEIIRGRCYRILLAIYKFYRVIHWDQVRRAIKRELIEADNSTLDSFKGALLLLSSLPAAEKCMFVCSKEGASCIKTVAHLKDPSLRSTCIPIVSQSLLASWTFIESSSDAIEGLQSQWIAMDGHDSEVEYTASEPHRIREDLYCLMMLFYKECALGCLGSAPSSDTTVILPDSLPVVVAYFRACHHVVSRYAAWSRADPVARWLDTENTAQSRNDALLCAAISPFLSVILDTLLSNWTLACDRARQLVARVSSTESHHGISLLSQILLLICHRSSESSSTSVDCRTVNVVTTSEPYPESLRVLVLEWMRLHLVPLLDQNSTCCVPSCRVQTVQHMLAFLQLDGLANERRCVGAVGSIADAVLAGCVRCIQYEYSSYIEKSSALTEKNASARFKPLLLLLLHLRENRQLVLSHLPLVLEPLLASIQAAPANASSSAQAIPNISITTRVITELVVLMFTVPIQAAGLNAAPPLVSASNSFVRSALGSPFMGKLFSASRGAVAGASISDRGYDIGGATLTTASCRVCIRLLARSAAAFVKECAASLCKFVSAESTDLLTGPTVDSDSAALAKSMILHLPDTLSSAVFILNKFSHCLSQSRTGVDRLLVSNSWLALAAALCEFLFDVSVEYVASPPSAVIASVAVSIKAAQMELVAALDSIFDWNFESDCSASTLGPKLAFLVVVSKHVESMSAISSTAKTHRAVLRSRCISLLDQLLQMVSDTDDAAGNNASGQMSIASRVSSRVAIAPFSSPSSLGYLLSAVVVADQVLRASHSIAAGGASVSPKAMADALPDTEVNDKVKQVLARVDSLSQSDDPTHLAVKVKSLAVMRRLQTVDILRNNLASSGSSDSRGDVATVLGVGGGERASALGVIEEVMTRYFDSPPRTAGSGPMSALQKRCCEQQESLSLSTELHRSYSVISGSNDPLVILVALDSASSTTLGPAHSVSLHIKAINASGFQLPTFNLDVMLDSSVGSIARVGEVVHPERNKRENAPLQIVGNLRPVDGLRRGGMSTWMLDIILSSMQTLDAYKIIVRVNWPDLEAPPTMADLGIMVQKAEEKHVGDPNRASNRQLKTFRILTQPFRLPVLFLFKRAASPPSLVEWQSCWNALSAGSKNIKLNVQPRPPTESACDLIQDGMQVDQGSFECRDGGISATYGGSVALSSHVHGWMLHSIMGDTVALCVHRVLLSASEARLELRGSSWHALEAVSKDLADVLLRLTAGSLQIASDDDADEEGCDEVFLAENGKVFPFPRKSAVTALKSVEVADSAGPARVEEAVEKIFGISLQ